MAAWLLRRASLVLLVGGDSHVAGIPARRFAHAWPGVMGLGLAWGIAAAMLWNGSRALFGSTPSSDAVAVLPAVVVLVGTLLGPCRRSMLALVEIVGGRSAEGRHLATTLLVVLLLAVLLGLKGWNEDRPWTWLRPEATYRVLILAPVWGAWAMLIVGQFCRPGPATEPAVEQFARGCGPVAAAGAMAAPLGASLIYFNYMTWWQVTIPLAAIVSGIGGGLILARLTGGLKRGTLLATNMLTQFVFYLAFLANR